MTQMNVSRPVLAGLLLTLVLTVIALLQPDSEANSAQQAASAELVAERPASATADEAGNTAERKEATSWQRQLTLPKAAVLQQGFAPPPPPAPIVAPVAPLPPPAPVKPVAPTPAFRYIGRLVRDNHVYVFLANADDVEVVAVGDTVDSNWRVEQVGESNVELRYLPLNETRQLAMSKN